MAGVKRKGSLAAAFSYLRTLKVGLLVPSSWPFPGQLALRRPFRFQARICSCIGLPWHSRYAAVPSAACRSRRDLSGFRRPPRQRVLPLRPPPPITDRTSASFAGRLSTSELAGAEAFASSSILAMYVLIANFATAARSPRFSTCRFVRSFCPKLKVICELPDKHPAYDLRKICISSATRRSQPQPISCKWSSSMPK